MVANSIGSWAPVLLPATDAIGNCALAAELLPWIPLALGQSSQLASLVVVVALV